MTRPRPLSRLKGIKPILAVAVTAAAFCSSANAKPCFDKAYRLYNMHRAIQHAAPYNSVKIIKPGELPIACKYVTLDQVDYAFAISCQDGYRYEVGTTPWCLRPGEHNDIRKKCEKAIVIAPDGRKTYHLHSEVF